MDAWMGLLIALFVGVVSYGFIDQGLNTLRLQLTQARGRDARMLVRWVSSFVAVLVGIVVWANVL